MDDYFDIDDVYQDGMDVVIPFGKHYGTPIKELPVGYVEWLLSGCTHGWAQEYRNELHQRLTYVDPAAIPEYTLKSDQLESSAMICDTFFSGLPIARLQGGAGYGKSFTAIDVVLKSKARGYQVAACATSYVATQNLAKDLEPLGVVCKTIAAMFLLDVVWDGPTEKYVPGVRTEQELRIRLGEGNLLIVDEYSMVEDNLGQMMIDAALSYGGRLLVIGDVYQLPSPAQSWDSRLCRVEPSTELWLPKRYSTDSTLYAIEKAVRQNPLGFRPEEYLGDEVTAVQTWQGLIDAYVSSYQANPGDHHLLLTYKRQSMSDANAAIRGVLFGNDAPEVCEGEQLRVQRTADFTPYYGGDGTRVYSGTTMTVSQTHETQLHLHIPEASLAFTVPVTVIDTTEGNRYAVLFSVNESQAQTGTRGAAEFNQAIAQITEWCRSTNNWKPLRDFRNCFVQVAYEYASTVHRVQGQSVDRIFTSPRALREADPYVAKKLSYVGLTRAKKKLVCCN